MLEKLDQTVTEEVTESAKIEQKINLYNINLNGTFYETGSWMSHLQGLSKGLRHTAKNTTTKNFSSFKHHLYHALDANYDPVLSVLNTGIWNDGGFEITLPLPYGYYRFHYYVAENYQDYFRSMVITTEHSSPIVVPAMKKGTYFIGYTPNIWSDGTVNIWLTPNNNSNSNQIHIMGLKVYRIKEV